MSAAVKLHPRAEDEYYVEPHWATALLLKHENFAGLTWDPACGSGNICKALRDAKIPFAGSDIVRRSEGDDPWWITHHDFLGTAPAPVPFDNIITNPPFFHAVGTEAFIRKALSVASGKVAVFTDVKFLASQRRADGLFAEHCPHRVWIHAKRPSCPPGAHLAAGHEAKGGTADWVWLIWCQNEQSVTTAQLGWLRS